jgi:hypothetical protein
MKNHSKNMVAVSIIDFFSSFKPLKIALNTPKTEETTQEDELNG